MKEGIVVIGGGGHAKSVIDALCSRCPNKQIAIIDNELPKGTKLLEYSVFGTDDCLSELYKSGYIEAVIAVGSIKTTRVRRNIYSKIKNIGYSFPIISDKSSTVAQSAMVSEGVFVGKNAVVNSEAKIGKFGIINTGAIIEHDCQIGDFTHISVGAIISGNCSIGEDVFVGANSTIIQGVKVGMNCVIGAGSVVLADVPDNTQVVGVWKNSTIYS